MSSPDTEISQHSGQLESYERHGYKKQYVEGVDGFHVDVRQLECLTPRSTGDLRIEACYVGYPGLRETFADILKLLSSVISLSQSVRSRNLIKVQLSYTPDLPKLTSSNGSSSRLTSSGMMHGL